MPNDIELVSREFIDRLLNSTGEKYEPFGKFICVDIVEGDVGVIWTAVDNSTGEAITEEFPHRSTATRWLHGYRCKNLYGEILNNQRGKEND